MGTPKIPSPVKLFIGLLGSDPQMLAAPRLALRERFGPEEDIMPPIPFTFTDYYAAEIGPRPWRTFIAYETLVDRETLVDAKLFTNELEQRFARQGLRPVNLDPGYMTLGQLFLASTKDQRWRVYVRDGIFVETTLYYQSGKYEPFPWTYPDYRSEEYLRYFATVRAKLAYQRNHDGQPYSTRKTGLPRAEGEPGGRPA